MYCQECDCEYAGWSGRCPTCGTPLVRRAPRTPAATPGGISYDELVNLVAARGGQMSVPLAGTEYRVERKWRFPYSGFGYGWVERLQGAEGTVTVDLRTAEVGRRREHRFPYFGYGYAWEQEMRGQIGQTEVTVTAREVGSDRTTSFPWLGRGYAWTKEWSGSCGPQLEVRLSSTEVERRRASGFPYRGYGFAWTRKAMLTLSLMSALEAEASLRPASDPAGD